MAPVLTDHQFQYGDSGLLINGDAVAPFMDIDKVDGLDMAPFRVSTKAFEGMDGGYLDAEFEDMRTVVLEGTIYASSGDTLEAFLDDLKYNFRPGQVPTPFYFKPGTSTGQRLVYAKSLGVRYSWDMLRRVGASACQIQLMAEDPTIYEGTAQTGSMVLGALAVTGRGYDKAFNYGYGGGYFAGAYVLTNDGNKNANVQFTLNGPLTNPRIVNDDLGVYLELDTTLLSGDSIVIDMYNRTITLNGTASRRNVMTAASDWFLLSPGANNIRFQSTGGSGTASYSFRNAYE